MGPDTANVIPFSQINVCCFEKKLRKENTVVMLYTVPGLPPSKIRCLGTEEVR